MSLDKVDKLLRRGEKKLEAGYKAYMEYMKNRKANCPNKENHTEAPSGYIAAHEWAEGKQKTHKQKRCPGCQLYLIWEPK